MGFVTKNLSTISVQEEVTEGVYVAPTSGLDYLEMKGEGGSFTLERDLLDRDILSSTTEVEASRLGMKTVSGEVPLELRANSTAGEAPRDLDLLLKSLLGGKRQIANVVTSGTGHTATQINIGDPDISNYSVGDIVVVKEAGAFEARPITVVDTSIGAAFIQFAFALDNGAPSDNVLIEKASVYYSDTNSSKTLSVENNMGGDIREEVSGLRVQTGAISNWTTGQIPDMGFTLTGLNLLRSVAGGSFSPTPNDATPPVALKACAWLDGTMLDYNEFSLNIENQVSTINSACSEDGKIASRVTSQTTTASVNPYMSSTDVNRFDSYNLNDDVSYFAYASVPTTNAGEFEQVVAVWLPQAKVISIPSADVDGIMTDAIELKAHRNLGMDSVFLGFI